MLVPDLRLLAYAVLVESRSENLNAPNSTAINSVAFERKLEAEGKVGKPLRFYTLPLLASKACSGREWQL